jgi:hypothetical protein
MNSLEQERAGAAQRGAVKRPFHYFDEETLTALRAIVRKEHKERSENFRSWTTLTIGIIGALIGLVAMLKK